MLLLLNRFLRNLSLLSFFQRSMLCGVHPTASRDMVSNDLTMRTEFWDPFISYLNRKCKAFSFDHYLIKQTAGKINVNKNTLVMANQQSPIVCAPTNTLVATPLIVPTPKHVLSLHVFIKILCRLG